MLCDRFNGEHLITLTQHIEPGALKEPDPLKRLMMFSVTIDIKARMHIIKSLFPITSAVLNQNEVQIRQAYEGSFAFLSDYLERSMK